jgi:hypothetical protein
MATSVLTQLGEEWVVDRLVDASGTYDVAGNYVGWGTGTGTANKTDTTLFTQSNDPVSTNMTTGTVSKTGTDTSAKWQCVATLASTSSQTITNAGTFSAANASTAALFVKGDFTGIPLVSGDSIQFTFTLDPA